MRSKITMANKKKATIRIPYCAQHSREATRNWTIIKVASVGAVVVGILVVVGSALWLRRLTDYNVPLEDLVEATAGASVAALCATYFLVLPALSFFVPSIKDSYGGLLGLSTNLEKNALIFTFSNDQIAADFKRVNQDIQVLETPLPHVPHKRGSAVGIVLFAAAIALLLGTLAFVVWVLLLQPR